MKRLIATLTAVSLIFAFASCNKTDATESTIEDPSYNLEELKQNDGEMFRYSISSNGEYSSEEEHRNSESYTVYYNGTIEHSITYNIAGTLSETSQISDEDYKAIYDECVSITESTNEYNGADAPSEAYYFYSTSGDETLLYYAESGSNSNDLTKLSEIVCSYFTGELTIETTEATEISETTSEALIEHSAMKGMAYMSILIEATGTGNYRQYVLFFISPEGQVQCREVYSEDGITSETAKQLTSDDYQQILDLLDSGLAGTIGEGSAQTDYTFTLTFYDEDNNENVLSSTNSPSDEFSDVIDELLNLFGLTL
ncbi:MAG: hypothetical protein K5745_04150 [Saccharofermentans sp.]|nr:hypothetical protein [Saccharofermentans sp.]